MMHGLSQYREDGRKQSEIRFVNIQTYNHFVHLSQGNTQVRVKLDGPKEGTKLYFNINFTNTSRQEQISDKRIFEYETELYNCFNNIILNDNQLDINIEVIQEDGSLLSVMINCITLALCYSNIPIIDYPVSMTYNKDVDLSNQEGYSSITLVYLINRNKVVYYKLLGRITYDMLRECDIRGIDACKRVYGIFREYLLR